MLDRSRGIASRHASAGAIAQLERSDGRDFPSAGYGYEAFEGDDAFNPLKLFFYIIQYRWLLSTLAAIGLVAALVVTMMMTPKYRATASLEVQVPSAKVFQDIEVTSEVTDVRTFLTSREKLKSRAIAQRAVFNLGLSEKEDFLFPQADFSPFNLIYRAFGLTDKTDISEFSPEDRQRIAVDRVLRNLTVELVPNTSLLSVTYSDQQAKYAQEVANSIAQSFIDQRVDQTSDTSTRARQFIQEQVLQVKERLQASEKELVNYAKTAGITVTGSEGSLIGENLTEINKALAAAIQERLDYGRLVKQIENGQGGSLEEVLKSDGLEKLRGKLAELNGEYQQKLSLYKPSFPEMRQLRSQITELENQANQAILAINDSIRLKYEEASGKVDDLRNKVSELEAEQAVYQDKNIQYTILKREVDSNRSQYDSLIAKLNEVAVSSELKSQNASVVDLAVLPRAPYSPRLTLNLAAGLAILLAIGAGIIYVLELLNNTFTNPEQVEKELGLAILGILPAIDERGFSQALADPKSSLSESYRSLRTSLQFSGTDGAPRTLLVTSSEPSEGKSTTVFKLAEDFTSLGANVIVVDADMRKPSAHRIFGVDNTIGLSNVLTSTFRREDMGKLIKRKERISIITAGTIPPNPADLLSSTRMSLLLENLGRKYDVVLVDAPPVIGLSDAPILSRLTEATLLVVSTNQVTRKSARAALKRIRAAGANVIGAAMTKFAVGKFDYNYSYKYLNYNYYNYGSDQRQLVGATFKDTGTRDASNWSLGALLGRLRRQFGNIADRIKSVS